MDNNVVFLNQRDGKNDKNVERCIGTFLSRIEQNSVNTYRNYKIAIERFFKVMRGKEIKDLIESDLIFSREQIEYYQVEFKKQAKSATVNLHMSAMKKCYSKLESYGFDVKEKWFNIERYKETSDREIIHALTRDEILEIIDLVSNTRAGEQKSLLIKLGFATAFRKESLLTLKWSDIQPTNTGEYIVSVVGKGQKLDKKKISKGLYEDLMVLKSKSLERENVFTLTDKTVQKMMNYIREKMDFGNRNISFHSLKKSSVNEVGVVTNFDVKTMQRHGNHSSAKTTMDIYLEQRSLDDLVTIDVNDKFDFSQIEELNHEELVGIIKSLDRATQIKIINKIKKTEI